jgi:hypothetical protein
MRTFVFLERDVSTCLDHLHVMVTRNEVPVGCYCTYMIYVGDVMCVLDWFACSVGVSAGLCFVFRFV